MHADEPNDASLPDDDLPELLAEAADAQRRAVEAMEMLEALSARLEAALAEMRRSTHGP
jgi:hypothetical protein